MSISEQLLTIYNSKEDAFKMGAFNYFNTVYMTDNYLIYIVFAIVFFFFYFVLRVLLWYYSNIAHFF